MKKISLMVFGMVAFTALTASASDHNVYLKMGAGLGIISGKVKIYGYQGTSAIAPNPFVSTALEGEQTKTTTGTMLDISLGHRLSPNMRAELSYMRLMNQNTNIDNTILGRRSETATVGAYYDIDMGSAFTPYIGAFIGYGSTQYSVTGFKGNPQLLPASGAIFDALNVTPALNPAAQTDLCAMDPQNTKKNKKSFVGGLKLGISYKLNKYASLDLEYNIRNLAAAETVIPADATFAAGASMGSGTASTVYGFAANTAPAVRVAVTALTVTGYTDTTLTASKTNPLIGGTTVPNGASYTGTVTTPLTLVQTAAGTYGTPVAFTAKAPKYLNGISMGLRLEF